jgi:FtsH-binding integral membrane protein
MALAQSRPIEGAVATLGVSERVAFLRRTYGHLGGALVAWVALTVLLFGTEFSLRFSAWALQGHWLIVLVAFMAIGFVTDRLARSEASPVLQYLGLGLGIGAWAMLLQPLLWVAYIKLTPTGDFTQIVTAAGVITGLIFVGLTLTVFITKKDFSFLRGILMIATFAALGIIVASLLFGFQLGAVFAGAMILLMAGYILFQTSLIMAHFPPTMHVAAALMLFSTVATLFWYVLQLLMSLNRN